MKKATLFISMYTVVLFSQAQITMTTADYPVAGEIWYSLQDNSTPHVISAGSASAQAWDLSAGFVANDTSAIMFIDPSTLPAPYNGQFPNADLAVYSASDSVAQYFDAANDGFYFDGIYTQSSQLPFPVSKVDYIPNGLILPVPLTYGNTKNHTQKLQINVTQGPATIKFRSTTIQSFVCDAFGTIKLPDNTTHTVIRVKLTEMTYDSTYVNYGIGGDQLQDTDGDTSLNYQFWQNGSHCLVAELNSTYGNSTHSDDFQYYTPTSPIGVNKSIFEQAKVIVYPNPVLNNDVIRFNIQGGKATGVKVFDTNGKLVVDGVLNNVSQLSLPTEHMDSGFYFYQLINDGKVIDSGKFNVVK